MRIQKLIVASIFVSLACFGQALAGTDSLILAESKTRSQDWAVRYDGFLALQREADAEMSAQKPVDDQIKTALINLLKTEVKRLNNKQYIETPEAYSDYFPLLLASVSDLHDVRAVSVLGDPAVLRTGNIAQSGLAALGHPAAQLVISEAEQFSDSLTQTALMQTAGMIMESKVSLPNDRALLKGLLESAARDKSPFVRISSVAGLMATRESSSMELLERLASTDPYEVSLNGKLTYPVRESARRVLATRTNGTAK